MDVAPRLNRRYRVRFDEAGANGHLRSSGFLRYAQDLAWVHSESAGFGRDWYAERGLTWLVRSIELNIVDDVAYGAEVEASTEVVGFRRVWARRRSEFSEAATGRALAVALTDWVLLDRRGVPVRVPTEIVDLFAHPPTAFTPLRVELSAPDGGVDTMPVQPRHSDLDPMGHVNNAVYVDYLEEHLAAVGRRGQARHRPRRYRAEFVGSAEQGTTLVGEGWADAHGYAFTLATADGGETILRAQVETDPAAWVGG